MGDLRGFFLGLKFWPKGFLFGSVMNMGIFLGIVLFISC